MTLFARVLVALFVAAFFGYAVEGVKLLQAGGRMLRDWNVDWVTLITGLMFAIVLAHQSWVVMIGIVLCMQLARNE